MHYSLGSTAANVGGKKCNCQLDTTKNYDRHFSLVLSLLPTNFYLLNFVMQIYLFIILLADR